MDDEQRLVVFNKYANPIDANIVKGALETAGIPAGVIGDNYANNLWKDAIMLVVFRRDLEDAIKALYGGEFNYDFYKDEMDLDAFENLKACNETFCEIALKIHPELDGGNQKLYLKARLAFDEGDLNTLKLIQQSLK